jgi:ubiquinone biosynthesis protein COQ4
MKHFPSHGITNETQNNFAVDATTASNDVAASSRSCGRLGKLRVALMSFALMVIRKKHQQFYAGRFLLATEGQTFERSFRAFIATSAGHDLSQRRLDLGALSRNSDMLEACPPNSLGNWYARFMTAHGLDEEYYLGIVSENSAHFVHDPKRAWYRTRVDAGHDMRHVLSGYGPDTLGEVCLLTFRFAQTKHVGVLALTLLGFLALGFSSRGPKVRPLLEAYRRGRRAVFLDLLPWEQGLDQPLSTHRAALGLTPPKYYPAAFAPDAYVFAEGASRHS